MLESPDGKDLYLVTLDAVLHLKRDPAGGLRRPGRAADCFQSRGRGCTRVAGIAESNDSAKLELSGDGRWLYATFGGQESSVDGTTYPGAVLWFERDASTGALTPRGCTTGPHGATSGCTGWSVLHPLLPGMTAGSDTLAYTVSWHMVFEGGESLVALRRDLATGELSPVEASCHGRPSQGWDDHAPLPPPGGIGEPCSRVPEWEASGALPAAPLVSADGRNVYVWSEARQNFADLPTLYGYSALIGFTRDPSSGRLTRLPEMRGCLGARYVDSCRRLAARFLIKEAIEAAGGRALVLTVQRPRRGTDTVLAVLKRDAVAGGVLSPVTGRRACAAVGPRRGCQRIRGLRHTGFLAQFPPSLVASPDGRHVYAFREEGAAIFRVRG